MTMLRAFLSLTMKGIRHRPLRSWLTIVGIVIGVMLVVVIFALGSGIQHAVSQMLQRFGSDLIIIFPGKETNPFAGAVSGERFRDRDLLALENLRGVRLVVPLDVAQVSVEFRGEKKTIMVHAGPFQGLRAVFEESQGTQLAEGSWPINDDSRDVILGYLTAHSAFKTSVRVGDEIIMKAKRMRVAGIFARIGTQDDDNSIFVSLKTLRELTGRETGAISAMVKVEPEYSVDLVGREIRAELAKQEAVHDFSVLTPERVSELIGSVLSIVELALIVIALISLVVGAVGIMNTMYTSVLERTRQIGIMKAVGASRDGIMSLFLIESGMIGAVGGILGIVLGIFWAFVIGIVAEKLGVEGLFSFASLDYLGIFVILVITFLTGVISGVLPARQASRMEPAEALRYE